ncbi:MAG: hypothetical protein JRJ59_04360 [Deltaproteobacteria bacterium]|nr:hypothetical protein [Deltaproteobacteria bacterium]
MKKLLIVILGLFFMLGAGPAWADEIADQIELGLKLYKEGKIAEALSELDFAVAQLRQKKAEGMGVLFPDALPGWKAEEAQAESMGQAMFGGGITASREYSQESGPGRVKIEILSDSPMIQTFAMLISNPALLKSSKKGKAKLVRVAKQKAVLNQEDSTSAELQMVFNNKVLIKVDVSETNKADQVAMDYAQGIDFDKLKEMTQ